MWIKRGDFVVVKPIEEGDKVKAEILTILYKEQIKYIKAEKLWPSGFEDQKVEEEAVEARGTDCDDDSDDESDLFQNTNRPTYEKSESSEETDSEDEN